MNIQIFIKDYQDGLSLAKMANKYNLTTYMVKKLLKENNVTIRTRSQQNIFTNQERGKKVNHEFFDKIDSNIKAYILGFIAADGTVFNDRNSISINLSSVDREILERIQNEIGIERQIRDYQTGNGFNVSALTWSSAKHKKILSDYSIVPNKTQKRMSFKKVPEKHKLAYILGYYDGDGTFKSDNTTCRFEICSGRPELLQEIAEFINSKFNANIMVYKAKSRNNYYTITYSTKIAEPLLDYLYSTNTLFLKRKYDKYVNWKNNKI